MNVVDELRELAHQLHSDGRPTETVTRAIEHIEQLQVNVADLTAQLAGHRLEQMRRDVAHLPEQGPCRADHFDPHLWERVKGSDSACRCVKCGAASGK